MIQKKSKSNQDVKFLTKKRVLLGALLLVISIALIILSVFFILDIDFDRFFNQLGYGIAHNPLAALWLTLLIIFLFYRIFYYAVPFIIRFKKCGIKCQWYEWILFSLVCMFMAGITPTAAGSEPYMLWFCKSKGLSVSESTALIFSNGFIVQFVSCLLALPCFIYFCILIPQIINISGTGWLTVVIVILGMLLMIGVNVFYGLLCWSKKAHYYLSRIWNRTKQALRLPYHTKAQTKKTYLVDQMLKREFVSFIKKYGDTALIVFSVAVMYIMLYCCLYFCADLCGQCTIINDQGVEEQISLYGMINFLNFFWCVDLAVSVNGYIPLPGSEGTIQIVLKDLLKVSGNFTFLPDEEFNTIDTNSIIDDSILLWRCMTFYFPVLLSSISIIWMGIKIAVIKISKKKKKTTCKK